MTAYDEKMMRVEGVITKAMGTQLSMSYVLGTGERKLELEWGKGLLSVGDRIRAEGELEGDIFFASTLEKLEGSEGEKLLAKLERIASEKAVVREVPLLIDDENMGKMQKTVYGIAKRMKAASLLGRAILVRFNNDADGISGGLAISSLLKPEKANFLMHPSAVYGEKEAGRDISLLGQEFKPLLVLVDFGANEESIAGLRLAKDAGFEIFVIDHHPPSKEAVALLDLFLSPWAVGAGSEYTAGYLCTEVAKAGGCDEEEMNGLARISFAGDRSSLVKSRPEALQKALVLDYLATVSEKKCSPELFEKILGDKEQMLSLAAEAGEKLEAASSGALANAKEKKIAGFRIFLFDLDKFITKNEFPNKGKLAGAVFDKLVAENPSAPIVVIGCSEKVMNFRVSRPARERGFDAAAIIEAVKSELRDGIESGGGHPVAASVRVNRGFDKIILEQIMQKIERIGAE